MRYTFPPYEASRPLFAEEVRVNAALLCIGHGFCSIVRAHDREHDVDQHALQAHYDIQVASKSNIMQARMNGSQTQAEELSPPGKWQSNGLLCHLGKCRSRVLWVLSLSLKNCRFPACREMQHQEHQSGQANPQVRGSITNLSFCLPLLCFRCSPFGLQLKVL